MDSTVILSFVIPVIVTGLIVFLIFYFKKKEALTYAEFFMEDTGGRYLHILGARRIMPENGDSFDIFEHYLFDLNGLKFIKGGSQRGKNLDLGSDFVKRSMAGLSASAGTNLEFKMKKEGYDDERDGLLKVYRFESIQSDTEVIDPISKDSLVFINLGDTNERFMMQLYRHGQKRREYQMQGMSDYFFRTIYLEDRLWVCFLYRKQKTILRSGMALCILNYETGEMIFDGFVCQGKA